MVLLQFPSVFFFAFVILSFLVSVSWKTLLTPSLVIYCNLYKHYKRKHNRRRKPTPGPFSFSYKWIPEIFKITIISTTVIRRRIQPKRSKNLSRLSTFPAQRLSELATPLNFEQSFKNSRAKTPKTELLLIPTPWSLILEIYTRKWARKMRMAGFRALCVFLEFEAERSTRLLYWQFLTELVRSSSASSCHCTL